MGCEGFGLPFFDVTVPYEANLLDGLAVLYSMLPWILAFVLLFVTLYHRTTTSIAACIFGMFMVVINEAIIKQIVSEPRPRGSCLTSKGMPSSHSVLSIGYTLWIVLEAYFHSRRHPAVRYVFALAIIVLLVPVPSSRLRLKDHSAQQILVGSCVGMAAAIAYFLLLRHVVAKRFDSWVEHHVVRRAGITNDYGHKSIKGRGDTADVESMTGANGDGGLRRKGSTSLSFRGAAARPGEEQAIPAEPEPPGHIRRSSNESDDIRKSQPPPALPLWRPPPPPPTSPAAAAAVAVPTERDSRLSISSTSGESLVIGGEGGWGDSSIAKAPPELDGIGLAQVPSLAPQQSFPSPPPPPQQQQQQVRPAASRPDPILKPASPQLAPGGAVVVGGPASPILSQGRLSIDSSSGGAGGAGGVDNNSIFSASVTSLGGAAAGGSAGAEGWSTIKSAMKKDKKRDRKATVLFTAGDLSAVHVVDPQGAPRDDKLLNASPPMGPAASGGASAPAAAANSSSSTSSSIIMPSAISLPPPATTTTATDPTAATVSVKAEKSVLFDDDLLLAGGDDGVDALMLASNSRPQSQQAPSTATQQGGGSEAPPVARVTRSTSRAFVPEDFATLSVDVGSEQATPQEQPITAQPVSLPSALLPPPPPPPPAPTQADPAPPEKKASDIGTMVRVASAASKLTKGAKSRRASRVESQQIEAMTSDSKTAKLNRKQLSTPADRSRLSRPGTRGSSRDGRGASGSGASGSSGGGGGGGASFSEPQELEESVRAPPAPPAPPRQAPRPSGAQPPEAPAHDPFAHFEAQPDTFGAFVDAQTTSSVRPQTHEKQFRDHKKAARPTHESGASPGRELRSLSTVFPDGDSPNKGARGGSVSPKRRTSGPKSPSAAAAGRAAQGAPPMAPMGGGEDGPQESAVRPSTHQKKFRGHKESRQAKRSAHSDLPRSLSSAGFGLAGILPAPQQPQAPAQNAVASDGPFLFSGEGEDFRPLDWTGIGGGIDDGDAGFGPSGTAAFDTDGLSAAERRALQRDILGGEESMVASISPRRRDSAEKESKRAAKARRKSEAFFSESLLAQDSDAFGALVGAGGGGGGPATSPKNRRKSAVGGSGGGGSGAPLPPPLSTDALSSPSSIHDVGSSGDSSAKKKARRKSHGAGSASLEDSQKQGTQVFAPAPTAAATSTTEPKKKSFRRGGKQSDDAGFFDDEWLEDMTEVPVARVPSLIPAGSSGAASPDDLKSTQRPDQPAQPPAQQSAVATKPKSFRRAAKEDSIAFDDDWLADAPPPPAQSGPTQPQAQPSGQQQQQQQEQPKKKSFRRGGRQSDDADFFGGDDWLEDMTELGAAPSATAKSAPGPLDAGGGKKGKHKPKKGFLDDDNWLDGPSVVSDGDDDVIIVDPNGGGGGGGRAMSSGSITPKAARGGASPRAAASFASSKSTTSPTAKKK